MPEQIIADFSRKNADDVSMAGFSARTSYTVQREPLEMLKRPISLDDLLKITPLNSLRKHNSEDINQTMNDTAMSLSYSKISKIDSVARGYITRKGLRRPKQPPYVDTSNLSLAGSIRGMNSLAHLHDMRTNSIKSMQELYSKNGSTIKDNQSIQNSLAQGSVKLDRKKLIEVFNSISKMDMTIMNPTITNKTNGHKNSDKNDPISASDDSNSMTKINGDKMILKTQPQATSTLRQPINTEASVTTSNSIITDTDHNEGEKITV
ncbi:MAG: hypothetical protein MHPSP_002252 [Paramarteilia canceri]